MTESAASRDSLIARDAADPLAEFRERFSLPADIIYLDGNSLGALPTAVTGRLDRVVREEWGTALIRSWNDADWMALPAKVGDKIAQLICAPAGTVVAADSTSVNLFKLLVAALRLRPDRREILTERGNFPTDLYIASGVADLIDGARVRVVDPGDVVGAIGPETAVVLLTHVGYRSGVMHDLPAVTKAAHDAGALILWDLSHSAGVVPVDIAAHDADFAVGCGYKYLNGGPGAPAFLYVADRLQAGLRPAISGWMGHAQPFGFAEDYTPAPGITRLLAGTPPVLGLAALDAALDIAVEAGIARLREKSLALTEAFANLAAARLAGHDVEVVAPHPARRGGQIGLRHAQGYPIMRALIAQGVIGDFRPPDLMRFGFSPLYTRFVDLWDAVDRLATVLDQRLWDQDMYRRRAPVT